MGKSRQMSILEGLHTQRLRLDEGTSNFSAKLTTFLKDAPAPSQAFVKQALNSVYLGLKKDYGGYFEGKRPVIKNKNTYSIMTWKIQTNESTEYQFYNIMKKYWTPMKNPPMDVEIDGTRYFCIVQQVEEIPDYVPAAVSFRKNFSVETSTIVGVYSASYKNEKVDPAKPGDTFKFIVSVPNTSFAIQDNPEVAKKGQRYFFQCKDGSADYDSGSQEFVIDRSSGLRSIYKASRSAEKAFNAIYGRFTQAMSVSEIESVLSDNKVRLATSYYPDLL